MLARTIKMVVTDTGESVGVKGKDRWMDTWVLILVQVTARMPVKRKGRK